MRELQVNFLAAVTSGFNFVVSPGWEKCWFEYGIRLF